MGLTDNQKRLIQAVSQNDIQAAKKCAIACVTEDTTQKNSTWCKRYKSVLESSGGNIIELPYDLKGIICVEDVLNSFKEGRYYLPEREQQIFDGIIRSKAVCGKLMEMGISYPNTILLYGESGTGKTTFGRYVAYKTGLPFCYLNFSNLVDSYMGNTSKNISKAFSYAIENPCVLMLDEIDCISIRRSSSGSSGGTGGEMARITISLMQEFDRLPNDIIMIGATNRMDRIDEALLRRFTRKHEVKRLNEHERWEMGMKFFLDVGMQISGTKLEGITSVDDTQAGLTNRMIEFLVNQLMEE